MGCRGRAQLVALGSTALALLTGCEPPPSPAPSLLLLTASNLRAESLGCYGAAADQGSRICSLAERGALFVWAFSTQPETAPAAASLLTGRTAA